jgi:hypothetical protein
MRGGLDNYRSKLRDTPWKAFFLRWVEPEIAKQYAAKKEAGASPTGKKCETSPGKKYDLVVALDKGVIAMLRKAGVSFAGLTAQCVRAPPSIHRTARKLCLPTRANGVRLCVCASGRRCVCASVRLPACARVCPRVW